MRYIKKKNVSRKIGLSIALSYSIFIVFNLHLVIPLPNSRRPVVVYFRFVISCSSDFQCTILRIFSGSCMIPRISIRVVARLSYFRPQMESLRKFAEFAEFRRKFFASCLQICPTKCMKFYMLSSSSMMLSYVAIKCWGSDKHTLRRLHGCKTMPPRAPPGSCGGTRRAEARGLVDFQRYEKCRGLTLDIKVFW